MTTPRDFERRLAEHFHGEAPTRAPDWILPSALTTIETTRQRRGLTVLRRNLDMPMYAKLAAAAVVVIALGAFALWRLAPTGPGRSGPTPTASPTPLPTLEPSPAPTTYVAPALTESFTSDLHGISLSYPAGWTAEAATEPWATLALFNFLDPVGDFLYDPVRMDHLFLALASQPLGGTSFDQWSTGFLTGEGCTGTPVVVDGIAGVIGTDCQLAFVSAGGRGYMFMLYTSDDDVELQGADIKGLLVDILETVQLTPEDAVDEAPTASP